MQNFKDKVAVITRSGIGFAKRCITEQMKVVLADINQQNLNTVETELLHHTNSERLLSLKLNNLSIPKFFQK